MKVTAKVIKFPEFARLKVSPETRKRAAMNGGHVIENYAKINIESTFSDKSLGTLAGSVQTVVTKQDNSGTEVAVGPSAVYARIQELGGWIKPVKAKMLHWVQDGIDIFARAVYIPPRPYLRPAADDHMDEIKEAVGKVIADDIRGKV